MSAGDPQANCRKATDITELLLQVYLIAWTMTEAEDGERPGGRTTAARPADSADPRFGDSSGIVQEGGRRERRLVRHREQPARASGHRLDGARLTRGGCAAASPLNGSVTRLRDLHRPGRRLDGRRAGRRTAVCAPASQLTATGGAGLVSFAAGRFVSDTLSRPYLRASATSIREEVYVDS